MYATCMPKHHFKHQKALQRHKANTVYKPKYTTHGTHLSTSHNTQNETTNHFEISQREHFTSPCTTPTLHTARRASILSRITNAHTANTPSAPLSTRLQPSKTAHRTHKAQHRHFKNCTHNHSSSTHLHPHSQHSHGDYTYTTQAKTPMTLISHGESSAYTGRYQYATPNTTHTVSRDTPTRANKPHAPCTPRHACLVLGG